MEDILPGYLAIGVSYERFMDSCPVELDPFIEAHRKKMEIQNTYLYMQGVYFMDALMATLGNSPYFKEKSAPPNRYPDKPYPFFNQKEVNKAEKKKDLDEFIAQETIRRANWRMLKKHGEKA